MRKHGLQRTQIGPSTRRASALVASVLGLAGTLLLSVPTSSSASALTTSCSTSTSSTTVACSGYGFTINSVRWQ